MDQDNDGQSSLLSNNVVVLLLAMGSAAFFVSVYHLVAICCCKQHITDQNQQEQQHNTQDGEPSTIQSTITSSTSVAHLIPSHKYHKKRVGENGGDDQAGTCAVCLGDFDEGEELKTLPECMHSFHVPCIDMWLYSHTSCPICRASAAPSPAGLHHGPLPDFGHSGGDFNAHHSIDMVQIAVVQSGLVRR